MTPTAYGILIAFGMYAIALLAAYLAPEGYETDDGFCYGRREDGE